MAWAAEETFESYTLGADLSTLNGGTGWGGAWVQNATQQIFVAQHYILQGIKGIRVLPTGNTFYTRLLAAAEAGSGIMYVALMKTATGTGTNAFTLRSSGGARVSLQLNTSGQVTANGTVLGTYLAYQYVVIRVTYNVAAGTYTAAINKGAGWSAESASIAMSGSGDIDRVGLSMDSAAASSPYLDIISPTDPTTTMRYRLHLFQQSGGPQAGSTPRTASVTVDENNSLVLLLMSSATAGDNHGTPTIGGVAMTQVQSAITGTNRRDTLWYKEGVAAGSHTIQMAPSSISNRYSWGWAVIAGVKASGALNASAMDNTNTTGTSRTASLSASVANCLYILVNFNLYDPGANSDKILGTGDDANLFFNGQDKASGSFSMTATSSSAQNAYIIAAFEPAAGAGPTNPGAFLPFL